jgi:hypothetical protein
MSELYSLNAAERRILKERGLTVGGFVRAVSLSPRKRSPNQQACIVAMAKLHKPLTETQTA